MSSEAIDLNDITMPTPLRNLEPERALLCVSECQCEACGHHWTTSDLIMRTETGYSYQLDAIRHHNIMKEPSLVVGYFRAEAKYPACYRCVQLGLNEGWTTLPALVTRDSAEYDKDGYLKRKVARPTGLAPKHQRTIDLLSD